MARLLRHTFVLLVTGGIAAQNPPLNPTSNLTLDTNATQGQFAFASIDIPVGVRVTFTGSYPVQIRCDGDAVIRGQLDADAVGSVGGPGEVMTGIGITGVYVFGSALYCPPAWLAGPGVHAGLYGSVIPFLLSGGSPGGPTFTHTASPPFACWLTNYVLGGGGGGTLVLEAGGRIDVHGVLSANGDSAWPAGPGSGGSVLLRAAAGLTVHQGGYVGAAAPGMHGSRPEQGLIRLDSYAQPAMNLGYVNPPPLLLELPFLEETAPPAIGTTWSLRTAAPRGSALFLAASFQPGSFTNAFGTIGIDVTSAIAFAVLALPTTGHDPLANYQLAIANDPGLIGINLFVAGLCWSPTLPPRFTNTIATQVQ